MDIAVLGHDPFWQRIVSAVIAQDRHTSFQSRYWSVFEEQVQKKRFPILIYVCSGTGCPFAKQRCIQLTKLVQTPSVLLFSPHSMLKREVQYESLLHLMEIPFYPSDLLTLVRQIIKKSPGDSSSIKPKTTMFQPFESLPTWENEVELAPDLWFNQSTNALIRKDLRISLSPREGRLLTVLLQRQGQIVPFDDLFHSLWKHGDNGTFDNLYAVVRSLKRKLQWNRQGSNHDFIQNEYGLGYRLQFPSIEDEECHVQQTMIRQE